VWVVVVLIWRYVSLASITASVTFPLVLIVAIILTPGWDFGNLWPVLITAVAIPVMVIVRHRENIKRLRTLHSTFFLLIIYRSVCMFLSRAKFIERQL
jgi:glycerol-3-phosphate acyltransferase PlsY